MKNSFISGLGGFLCISLLAYLNSFDESNLWLIPPFGASMVLVMSVHESPLAHPKNVFFGHVISALSGVIVYATFGCIERRSPKWAASSAACCMVQLEQGDRMEKSPRWLPGVIPGPVTAEGVDRRLWPEA